jgi:hypothetical protein
VKREILATILSSISIPALAAFAIFQAASGGAPPLPNLVTTIPIDGGPTYYADNGFSNATSYPTSFNGVPYTNGWDDPKFFPTGWWAERLNDSTDVNTIKALGTNTYFTSCCYFSGQLALMRGAGISNLVPWQLWGQILATDQEPGSETVGVNTFDEPDSYQAGWQWAMIGFPASTATASGSSGSLVVTSTPTSPFIATRDSNAVTHLLSGSIPFLSDGGAHITPSTFFLSGAPGTGTNVGAGTYGVSPGGMATFGSETVTQAALAGLNTARGDGRFSWVNFTNAQIRFNQVAGVSMPTILGLQLNAPSGKSRHIDFSGIDWYFFTTAGFNAGIISPNNNQTASNMFDTSGATTMTSDQLMRGPHYGDTIDIHRSYMTGANGKTPIVNFLETSNALGGSPYDIQPVELNWSVWSMIIHGARGVAYFGQMDGNSQSGCGVNTAWCTYMGTAQTATLSGATIVGSTLTVPNMPTGGGQNGFALLAAGMQATGGITCSSPPCTILQQLSAASSATFTAAFSGTNNVILTVSGISGTITLPAILTGPGVNGTNLFTGQGTNPIVRSGITGTGGNGTYNVDASIASPSGTITATPVPGGVGTYKVSGSPSVSGTPVFQQWGWKGNGPDIATSMRGGITAISSLVSSLSPVIKSQFMSGFIASQSPDAYRFEGGLTLQKCGTGTANVSIQSATCGQASGIDSMSKYYTGAPYTAVTGDVISPGFYIFATTRNSEGDTGISATFNLCAACSGFTTADVIGESRSRPISAGSFTDTFANAWSVHIYHVH